MHPRGQLYMFDVSIILLPIGHHTFLTLCLKNDEISFVLINL